MKPHEVIYDSRDYWLAYSRAFYCWTEISYHDDCKRNTAALVYDILMVLSLLVEDFTAYHRKTLFQFMDETSKDWWPKHVLLTFAFAGETVQKTV